MHFCYLNSKPFFAAISEGLLKLATSGTSVVYCHFIGLNVTVSIPNHLAEFILKRAEKY